ncbi:hypothetical protein NDU88_008668 [Pleurodeles waltl]|uniref:Uncharacterized protein n=1 Tax=Pleurodeles waltl TaxID=8319 RepID=A0AAV7QSD9_PLEWA|nr:hypothetical protein NDU88_008668 [Pleurodeles waltl]
MPGRRGGASRKGRVEAKSRADREQEEVEASHPHSHQDEATKTGTENKEVPEIWIVAGEAVLGNRHGKKMPGRRGGASRKGRVEAKSRADREQEEVEASHPHSHQDEATKTGTENKEVPEICGGTKWGDACKKKKTGKRPPHSRSEKKEENIDIRRIPKEASLPRELGRQFFVVSQ